MAESPEERRARVLVECIAECERGGPAVLDRVCSEHPDLADEIRSAVRTLKDLQTAVPEPGEEPRALLPGRRVGRFRLVDRIGSGGMGVVYRARDEALERDVAIKFLPAPLATVPEALERFRREVRALAHARHPNIVAIHEVGETTDGLPYFAMDLVQGAPLVEILGDHAGADPTRLRASDLLPRSHATAAGMPASAGSYVEAVVRLTSKVADALDHAHRAGVIHRDVKAGNILVDAQGEPHLVDFGLARNLEGTGFTLTGVATGTPFYMAPEQVAGGKAQIGPPTDVFALGVTLYEALTLRRPFDGETTSQIFRKILTEEPPNPRRLNPSIPIDLQTVCLKAIEKNSARRYESARAFADDLRSLLELRPIKARPVGPTTRAVKWVRRNPGATAAGTIAAASVFLVAGILLARKWSEGRTFGRLVAEAEDWARAKDFPQAIQALQRAAVLRPDDPAVKLRLEELPKVQKRAESEIRIAEAGVRFEAFRDKQKTVASLEHDRAPLWFDSLSRYLPPEKRRVLEQSDTELRLLTQGATEEFSSALEELSAAERLDPENPKVRTLRAELYLEKVREAVARGVKEGVALYRNLVRQNDARILDREDRENRGGVAIQTDPEGVEVYLFRYQEQADLFEGGEQRLIPVPLGYPPPAIRPGSTALRVVQNAGDIEVDDLILSVAGEPVQGTVFVGREDERFDLLPLDVLLSIDGRPVRDLNDVEDFGVTPEDEFARDHPGTPVRPRPFRFRRGWSEREILATLQALAPELVEPDELVERGGIEAEVWHLGRIRRTILGEGLRVRTTAAPLFLSAGCLAGRTPLLLESLECGSYLAVLRRPGFENQRYPLVIERGKRTRVSASLNKADTSPEGFVFIPEGPCVLGGDADAAGSGPRAVHEVESFWIADHEVTQKEWDEFLADPEIQRRIQESSLVTFLPGEWVRPEDAALWKLAFLGDDLRYLLRPGFPPRPVYAISGEDAMEYAAWRTRKALEQGEPFEFSLPTHEQWEKAGRGADERLYPYGNRFIPWFMSTRTGRLKSTQRPVCSFPVDESPYGVFDLGGNQAEWCLPDAVTFRLRGGDWSDIKAISYRLTVRKDENWKTARTFTGIRLVAERR